MKKILLPLTILLLTATPALTQGGGEKLPLQKRVQIERLRLTEKYENAVKKCRERSNKRARHTCIEQKKKELFSTLDELAQTPEAYFAAQQRNELDRQTVENSARRGK